MNYKLGVEYNSQDTAYTSYFLQYIALGIHLVQQKDIYVLRGRPIGDPLETDMFDQRPIGDQHADRSLIGL